VIRIRGFDLVLHQLPLFCGKLPNDFDRSIYKIDFDQLTRRKTFRYLVNLPVYMVKHLIPLPTKRVLELGVRIIISNSNSSKGHHQQKEE